MNTTGIMTANVKMSQEDCKKYIQHFKDVQEEKPSSLESSNAQYKLMDRQDSVVYLNETVGNGLVPIINEYLNQAIQEYGKIFPILLDDSFSGLISTRVKLQRTNVGGGYHIWHFEDSARDVSERMLVWTIYLNDVEEGGETEFLYHSERHKAQEGKIVIFPANFLATHRGNPPISNTKYILTGWYNQL